VVNVVAALTPDLIVISGVPPEDLSRLTDWLRDVKPDIYAKYTFIGMSQIDRLIATHDLPEPVRLAATIVRNHLAHGENPCGC
jgi:hypothetical protein